MSGMQTSPDPLSQASVDACALRCGCIPLPPCLSRVNTPVTICVTRSVYLVCISWHGPGAGSIWSWTRAACLCTTLTPVPAPKPLLTLTYAGVGAEVLGVISLELHPHPISPTSATNLTWLLLPLSVWCVFSHHPEVYSNFDYHYGLASSSSFPLQFVVEISEKKIPVWNYQIIQRSGKVNTIILIKLIYIVQYPANKIMELNSIHEKRTHNDGKTKKSVKSSCVPAVRDDCCRFSDEDTLPNISSKQGLVIPGEYWEVHHISTEKKDSPQHSRR